MSRVRNPTKKKIRQRPRMIDYPELNCLGSGRRSDGVKVRRVNPVRKHINNINERYDKDHKSGYRVDL